MSGVKQVWRDPHEYKDPLRLTEDGSIHPANHGIIDTRTGALLGENAWGGEPLQRVEVQRGLWGTPHWQASFFDESGVPVPVLAEGPAREVPRFTIRLPGTITEEEALRVALTYMDVLEIRRAK